MQCRKCGRKKTVKRSAGVFHCPRCGMQPGILSMDRSGRATDKPAAPIASGPEYTFAARTPRLRGATPHIGDTE
jgi:hypothetical protein